MLAEAAWWIMQASATQAGRSFSRPGLVRGKRECVAVTRSQNGLEQVPPPTQQVLTSSVTTTLPSATAASEHSRAPSDPAKRWTVRR